MKSTRILAAALAVAAMAGIGSLSGSAVRQQPRIHRRFDHSMAGNAGGYRKKPRNSHKQNRRAQLKKNARRRQQ